MITRKLGYLRPLDADIAPAASKQLEQEGYCVIEQVFTPEQVQALASDVTRLFDQYPPDVRSEGRSAEGNAMFRYEALNKSVLAIEAVGHPSILAVIDPLLGEDCHVIANTAWRNPPSSNHLHPGESWHIDAGPHIPLAADQKWPSDIPHPVFAIGAHIFLRDCRLEDGPTGVIPGSHLSGRPPPGRQLDDPHLTYEQQSVVPLLAQAGDVALFVSDVWHRRMPSLANNSGRFFLQVHYGRRDIAQRLKPTDQANQLSGLAISNATSTRTKQLLGLHSPMFYDG